MVAQFVLADGYVQHNLVSDQLGVADHQDANLVNAWGISSSPAGPFWVSSNGKGVSALYRTDGSIVPLVVSVPNNGPVTGQVFAGGSLFGKTFIFAGEDGIISGWAGGATAPAMVDNSKKGAIYKGLGYSNNELYAPNFSSGSIERYNSSLGSDSSFQDSSVDSGYKPFNAEVLGGKLYVTYALANGLDDVRGAGHGYVDSFDLATGASTRLVTHGDLNSPWGLAIAPTGFGAFAGALLVGNFGDGKIHAYNKDTGIELGTLKATNGTDLAIDGLWGLIPGNGGLGGDAGKVYFSAGPGGETHGLFGSLSFSATPEPATLAVLGAGALALLRRRKK